MSGWLDHRDYYADHWLCSCDRLGAHNVEVGSRGSSLATAKLQAVAILADRLTRALDALRMAGAA